MPFLLRNRSFFSCYYHIDGCEPGEYQFIVSSLGCEEMALKHEKMAGSDVLGNIRMVHIGVQPIRNKEDGTIIGSKITRL